MKAIDLSHTVHTDMPVFPGDAPAEVHPTHRVALDGFAQTLVTMTTHTGTHLDTAAHLFADAPTLDWLGPDNFTGWGAVVDLTRLKGGSIEQAHLSELAGVDGLDFVLLYTGWDRYWETHHYFEGFPVLSETACRFLGGLGLKGLGMDTPSPDPATSHDLPAHHILFDHGLVIVENLTNLKELPGHDFLFCCQPLKIQNGEGSPVRAVGLTF